MSTVPDPLRAELDALRRQLQWLTAVCTFLGLGLILTFAYRFTPRDTAVSARRFSLVDERGRTIGEWTSWKDGSPVFRLNGPNQKERVLMLARPDGSSAIRMSDSLGVRRVYLELGADRWPMLIFTDHEGSSLVRIATGPDGHPRVLLTEPHPAAPSH